jgi:hypothetical protein
MKSRGVVTLHLLERLYIKVGRNTVYVEGRVFIPPPGRAPGQAIPPGMLFLGAPYTR